MKFKKKPFNNWLPFSAQNLDGVGEAKSNFYILATVTYIKIKVTLYNYQNIQNALIQNTCKLNAREPLESTMSTKPTKAIGMRSSKKLNLMHYNPKHSYFLALIKHVNMH